MKNRPERYLALVLSVILTSFLACTPEACMDETESFLDASFFSYSGKTAKTPDSLTVFGLGRDTSRIYSASKGIATSRLPLNPVADSTTFIIRINGVTDTVSFRHSSYPHLISRECGYTFFYNIDSLVYFTRNNIDSIGIRNVIITNLDEENIRIYY